MIVAAVFVVYAVLLFIDAGVSYRRTGAKPSLVSGIVSGTLLVVAAVLIPLGVPIAASMGLGVMLAMMGVFASRYLSTKAFFPTGVMLLASVLALGALLGLLRRQ